MLPVLLSAVALGSALWHLRAEYRGPRHHVYVSKPLTTFLILLIALQTAEPFTPFYKYAVAAGQIFSLAGDVLLMLPSNRFVAGLSSFLVAHLCYIAAFTERTDLQFSGWWAIPLLLYTLVLYRILAPHLRAMKVPVIAYMIVIGIMAWQALEGWSRTRETGALLAALGAVLFVVSDSALAINRFRRPFAGAQALVLGTYYSAQWLIALSVGTGAL